MRSCPSGLWDHEHVIPLEEGYQILIRHVGDLEVIDGLAP
jgi:hypothetical protein